MSQAKVDRYKKEKKNRAKMMKRKRAKKVAGVFVGAALIGAILGYPLGKQMYKISKARSLANATVDANLYQYWIQQYWGANYAGILGLDNDIFATPEDASAADAASEGATPEDAAEN